MALATLKDAKDILRVQTTAEDSLIEQFRARAQAMVETYIGVPITAVTDTVTDYSQLSVRAYAHKSMLRLDRYPIATSPAPVVTDTDGNVIAASTYTVDGRSGLIRATPGNAFDNGPYTIAGTIGLSAHPNYASRIEPLLNAAILDVVADFYSRRNPSTAMESAGGGVNVSYVHDGLPPRLCAMLAPLRVSVVA